MFIEDAKFRRKQIMGKRLIAFCAIALVLGLAVPAFAAVQNVKVSGDLTVSAIGRRDLDLGLLGGLDDDANVMNSIVRVRIDADLTDNVSTTVRLINERDWDDEGDAATGTHVDLDLAYVTMREMLYSPLTVTIGRQELRFGNGLIVGDPHTNNMSDEPGGDILNQDLSARKAFDATRATLDYDPLVIDFIYAVIDEDNKVTAATSKEDDDDNLYGLNAKYDFGDEYGTMAEAYFFTKVDKTRTATGVIADNKPDTVYCPGLRVSTNPTKKLNLQAEFAYQTGSKQVVSSDLAPVHVAGQNRQRKAMAGQFISTYALDMDYSPVLNLTYAYYSGENNPYTHSDEEYRGWDPMYEDQTAGSLINALLQPTNCHIADASVTLEPMEDVTAKLSWINVWLAHEVGEVAGSGTVTTQPGVTATNLTLDPDKRYLGYEIDAELNYDYTEDVQFGLLFGYFKPGEAWNAANNTAAKELIGTCKVVF